MKRLRGLVASMILVVGALAPYGITAGERVLVPQVAMAECIQLSVPISAKAQQGHCAPGQIDSTANGGAIVAYLTEILRFLSGLVGGVIVLMLIIAGIQYLVSTGDPGQVKAAKTRIINAITALVLFAFMYAILSFIIPGGIFS